MPFRLYMNTQLGFKCLKLPAGYECFSAMCNYVKIFVYALFWYEWNKTMWSSWSIFSWHESKHSECEKFRNVAREENRKRETRKINVFDLLFQFMHWHTDDIIIWQMKYDFVFTIRHVVSDRNHFISYRIFFFGGLSKYRAIKSRTIDKQRKKIVCSHINLSEPVNGPNGQWRYGQCAHFKWILLLAIHNLTNMW